TRDYRLGGSDDWYVIEHAFLHNIEKGPIPRPEDGRVGPGRHRPTSEIEQFVSSLPPLLWHRRPIVNSRRQHDIEHLHHSQGGGPLERLTTGRRDADALKIQPRVRNRDALTERKHPSAVFRTQFAPELLVA